MVRHISKVERGMVSPQVGTVAKILDGLDGHLEIAYRL